MFSPKSAILAWYNESKIFDYNTLSCSGVCGHYTQVSIWHFIDLFIIYAHFNHKTKFLPFSLEFLEFPENSPSFERYFYWV